MRATKRVPLSEAVENGKLERYLHRYLESCRPPPDADPKRQIGKFPNLAGFCRSLGCGIAEFDLLRLSHPAAADYLSAVLEDEALNAHALSPTLASAYLKRRLGYAEKSEQTSHTECGDVQVIFEHDIEEDGA